MITQVGQPREARDFALIAPFSKLITVWHQAMMNSRQMRVNIVPYSTVPNRLGIRRPSQAK